MPSDHIKLPSIDDQKRAVAFHRKEAKLHSEICSIIDQILRGYPVVLAANSRLDDALKNARDISFSEVARNHEQITFEAGRKTANDQVEARRDGAPLPEKTSPPLPSTSC